MKEKIPFKWRLRWFLQGMASVFGFTKSKDQVILEAFQCADEIEKEKKREKEK